MRRISVVGTSGSGKTRMANRLAAALDLPHLELDGVFHQPDWTPLPDEEFRSRVGAFTNAERWVVDGNYRTAGVLDLIWERADTVVWLDPSRTITMWQITTRTLARMARRTELWNGNRESAKNLLHWDPEENVIRWAWTRFDRNRRKYEECMSSRHWSHLTFHRLKSRGDQRRFLAGVGVHG